MKTPLQISVVGASGYTGMETIRLLQHHPYVSVTKLYGAASAGTAFNTHYKAMSGISELSILGLEELPNDTSDAIFLGLPHGKSANVVNTLLEARYKGHIIDMSSDFRLHSPEEYQKWYGWIHPSPHHIPLFVYGLTEWYRNDIRMAQHISNPGCFATAIQLGLLPFATEGLVESCDISGITGSSGSGASPSAGTHFSSRFGNVKAYKVLRHQHMGEVRQSLKKQAPANTRIPNIRFIPISGPFVRGIWMTLAFTLNEETHAGHLLEKAYYNAPLVRLQEGLPELKQVSGSAYTDIGWIQEGRNVVIGVALDNLIKGAAGQAIQNMNLLMEWPEETGLLAPPLIL